MVYRKQHVDKTYLNWFMSLCSLLRIMTLISANGLGAENNTVGDCEADLSQVSSLRSKYLLRPEFN